MQDVPKQAQKQNPLKRFLTCKSKLKSTLIIIAIALLLEITLFNRAHYGRFWQDAESTNFETVAMTYTDGVYRRDHESHEEPAFIFRDLNRRVNSVYVEAVEVERNNFHVEYHDRNSTRDRTYHFEVFENLEFTHYQEINPYGEVTSLKIVPHGHHFAVRTVAVNKTIPFQFVFWRFLIVASLSVGAYFLIITDIRKLLFNPKSKRQLLAFALTVALFPIFGRAVTKVSETEKGYGWLPSAYERMAESLLAGRLYLVTEQTEKLELMKGLEDPYVYSDRIDAGIGWTEFEWDNAYYDGNVYMQHGIGPVLAMFLPYYVITGEHVSLAAAVFIFASLAGIFLALLWREIVKQYFPKMPFVLFLCTTVAAMFCALISPQFYYTVKHSVAATSAVMFALLGLWLLLMAVNASTVKKQYILIVAGCFCTAFAVSCRASTALASFLVPVILWSVVFKKAKQSEQARTLNKQRTIKVLACVAVPYLAVALPLMWYNYVRFGNIAEFGTGYAITGYHNKVIMDLNPVAMVKLLMEGVRNILFLPMHFTATFPFVSNMRTFTGDAADPVRYLNSHAGMINFPIFWQLAFAPVVLKRYRKDPQLKTPIKLSIGMFAVAIATGVMSYVMVAAMTRYQIDYMYLLVLSALVIGYLAWEQFGRSSWFCKAMCVMCVISTAIALPLASEVRTLWLLPHDVVEQLRQVFTFF